MVRIRRQLQRALQHDNRLRRLAGRQVRRAQRELNLEELRVEPLRLLSREHGLVGPELISRVAVSGQVGICQPRKRKRKPRVFRQCLLISRDGGLDIPGIVLPSHAVAAPEIEIVGFDALRRSRRGPVAFIRRDRERSEQLGEYPILERQQVAEDAGEFLRPETPAIHRIFQVGHDANAVALATNGPGEDQVDAEIVPDLRERLIPIDPFDRVVGRDPHVLELKELGRQRLR